MTTIQQVLFEVERPYLGHPYFVTGHALYTAIARRVERDAIRRRLQVSHGVFLPGEYGEYPPAHSREGYAGKLGDALPPVETYADLFIYRDPAQRWLKAGRPRDAHNVHPIQHHGGRTAFAAECWFGRPEHMRNHRRSVQWYVHAYLHDGGAGDGDGVVPLPTDVLDGLQVGGARNYGFGELSLVDTQTVALDDLEFPELTEAATDAYQLELVTPYVLTTDHPDADDQTVPWWWDVPDETAGRAGGLRRRTTQLAVGADTYDIETVDHGQVVGYAGNDPETTAINGVLRVGSHAKYGFGEFRLRPAGVDRVPERDEAAAERGGTA